MKGSMPGIIALFMIALLSNTRASAQVFGTRSIPGSYPTIGAAIADIQTSGLSGHVFLELQFGYDYRNETYPIVIPENFPTSANATVTLRPRIGATDIHIGTGFLGSGPANTGDIPIFDIYGSYFNIDGRPGGGGTFQQLFIWSRADEGTAVQFSNNASNNTVSYCHLRGNNKYSDPFGAPLYRKGVVTFNPAGPFPAGVLGGIHDNTIEHNIIEGEENIPPNVIISSPFYSIYANGNPGGPNINNKILNNEIANFGYAGIEIKPDGPGAGWIIKDNSFHSSFAAFYNPEYAINIFHTGYRSGTNIIEGNYIGGTAALAEGFAFGGTHFAIVCGTYNGGDSVSVRNNVIKNMSKTWLGPDPPGTYPRHRDEFIGIAVINNGGSNKVHCTGNFIGGDEGIYVSANVTSTTVHIGNARFYGIVYNNCSGGSITQNTIQDIHLSSQESSTFNGIRAFVIHNVSITGNTIQQIDIQSAGTVTVNNLFVSDDHHEVPPCEPDSPQPVVLENNNINSLTAVANDDANVTGIRINERISANAGNIIGSVTQANSITATGNNVTLNAVLVEGLPEDVSISNDSIANLTATGISSAVVNGVHFNGTGIIKVSGNNIKNLTGITARGIFIEPLAGNSSATIQNNTLKGVNTGFGTGIQANIPASSTTNFIATNNTVNTWQTGFLMNAAPGSIFTQTVQSNFVTGNQTGFNTQSGSPQNATCNWWGSASGPSGAGPGTGDPVGSNVIFSPWATTPNFVAVDAGADQIIYLGYGPSSKTITPVYTFCGAATYSWSNGAPTANITVSPTVTTTYTITVSDKNGHAASDNVTITVKDVRCGNNKVKVCHKGKNTLCISSADVASHLAHGDVLGDCPVTARGSDQKIANTIQINSGTDVNIFPNPASGFVNLQWNGGSIETVSMRLQDIFGRVILLRVVSQRPGINNYRLPLTGIPGGNYILAIETKTGITNTKLRIQD